MPEYRSRGAGAGITDGGDRRTPPIVRSHAAVPVFFSAYASLHFCIGVEKEVLGKWREVRDVREVRKARNVRKVRVEN